MAGGNVDVLDAMCALAAEGASVTDRFEKIAAREGVPMVNAAVAGR